MRRAIGKAVAPTVDHLLYRKEGYKHAADRDCDVERCHWRHRRHAQALEAVQKIKIAEIDHADRNRENYAAIEQLKKQPLVATQRFGKDSEIEVVVAPSRGGHTDEYAIDDEAHQRVLLRQQRQDAGARSYVG